MINWVSDTLKLGLAGLLTLLWKDVRKLNNLKQEIRSDLDGQLGSYLTREKHEDLCKINTLELKAHISGEIKGMKDEVLTAINNGGRSKNPEE